MGEVDRRHNGAFESFDDSELWLDSKADSKVRPGGKKVETVTANRVTPELLCENEDVELVDCSPSASVQEVTPPKKDICDELCSFVDLTSPQENCLKGEDEANKVSQDIPCFLSDCSTQTSKQQVRDFVIPCLNSINGLKALYEPKYELHFNMSKAGAHKNLLNHYKYKKELQRDLEAWETELNDCSPNEPYIAVENKVDNEGPPKDFVYVSRSVIPASVNHLFDEDYLVGCSCTRCTTLQCECAHNNGGDFAYARFGRIQFKPGQPIYECNAKCSCSVTCRNRVVQRGRTVKVGDF